MNKIIISTIICVIFSSYTFADTATKIITAEESYRRTGGEVKLLPKETKKIYIVNAQQSIDDELILSTKLKIENQLKTILHYERGSFNFNNPKIFGELTLYIVDDQTMPMSLVAPEARWAIVNVTPLKKGRGQSRSFLTARFSKELSRIAAILFGNFASQYKQNILSYIDSPEALDEIESCTIPADAVLRSTHYLRQIGVKPWRVSTYYKACQEGWAATPTNDVQKAIWDKVHTPPANPMKIEFDPKKGR